MTTYKIDITNNNGDSSVLLTGILADRMGIRYEAPLMGDLGPKKEHGSGRVLAFSKDTPGTSTQQLVLFTFPKTEILDPVLYIFSRQKIDQDLTGNYDGQWIRAPSLARRDIGRMLRGGNIEVLVSNAIAGQTDSGPSELKVGSYTPPL